MPKAAAAATRAGVKAAHVRQFKVECARCGFGQGGDRGGLVEAVVGAPLACQALDGPDEACPLATIDTTK